MSHNKPHTSSCLAAQVASLAPVVGSRQCSLGGASSGLGVSRGSAPLEPAMLPD